MLTSEVTFYGCTIPGKIFSKYFFALAVVNLTVKCSMDTKLSEYRIVLIHWLYGSAKICVLTFHALPKAVITPSSAWFISHSMHRSDLLRFDSSFVWCRATRASHLVDDDFEYLKYKRESFTVLPIPIHMWSSFLGCACRRNNAGLNIYIQELIEGFK